MRTVLILALAAALAAAAPGRGLAQDAERVLEVCRDCHADTGRDRLRALEHADSLSCRSCHHVGLTNDPVASRANRLDACAGCHVDLDIGHAEVEEGAPECTACHVIHDDPALADVGTALVDARCAACHVAPHEPHAPQAPDAPGCADCHVEHGRRVAGQAPVTTACGSCHAEVHPEHAEVAGFQRCTQCHAVGVPAEEDVPAPIPEDECARCHTDLPTTHHAADPEPGCMQCHAAEGGTPQTACAACHEDEEGQLRTGGHGGVDHESTDAPGCVACHVLHDGGTGAAQPRRRALLETVRCIECHASEAIVGPYALTPSVGASYEGDFHGATVRFLAEAGSEEVGEDVLLCSDCHGAHDVRVGGRAELTEVCARCHQDADAKLAGAWLGHRPVGPGNGTLVWLVRLFYLVLIPFMLTGLFLNIAFHLIDQRRKGARVHRAQGVRRLLDRLHGKGAEVVETVVRFSRTERLEHAGAMVTFVLLVVTGLPQTRPDLGIAQAIISMFGGIWSTRLIHRIVGFTFVALIVLHVARGVAAALRGRRLPVMVPTRKDFEDVLQTFRHYLFRAPMPRVGKFDFSEKFEYWGLFLGGLVMSATGIALVFPELVTRFLPGIVVAALRVTHGLEATFAVLVIILWHSYGVILRPEIFPLDTTIFTGKMDVKRLRHEHALEYERLYGEEAGD